LDAIRTDNRTAAVEIVGTLRADLLGVRQAMLTDIGAVSDSVSALIEEARTNLSRLLG
jgi:nicotinamide mononucleotide (NMN) deamidase PncC